MTSRMVLAVMTLTAQAAMAQELPARVIPNIPEAAEAYFAPDSHHLIAQTRDPAWGEPMKDD